jgi:hypothetical protein
VTPAAPDGPDPKPPDVPDAKPPDGPDAKLPDPAVAKLLRWYPRAWRERYGDEFLAMVEDDLDGERPGLRFRLSLARAGLRERGHRVRLAGQRAALQALSALTGRWWAFFVAGYLFAILPYEFKALSGAAQEWPVTAALAALVAVAVLGGVAVLIGGLLALPAFGRFLRAGGWRQIRRRVAWAAGATAAAGGALAALTQIPGSMTYDQLSGSGVFFLGAIGTTLLLTAAIGLWANAAKATAKHLDLAVRVRADEMLLAAVTQAAALAMLPFTLFLTSATQSSLFQLLLGVVALATQSVVATSKIRRALRRGRRLRARAARARS